MTEPRPYIEVLLTRHQMIEAIRKIRQIHGPKEPPVTPEQRRYVVDLLERATICNVCLTIYPCETYRATM